MIYHTAPMIFSDAVNCGKLELPFLSLKCSDLVNVITFPFVKITFLKLLCTMSKIAKPFQLKFFRKIMGSINSLNPISILFFATKFKVFLALVISA